MFFPLDLFDACNDGFRSIGPDAKTGSLAAPNSGAGTSVSPAYWRSHHSVNRAPSPGFRIRVDRGSLLHNDALHRLKPMPFPARHLARVVYAWDPKRLRCLTNQGPVEQTTKTREEPGLIARARCAVEVEVEAYALVSSAAIAVWATVQSLAPTLNRANRRTEIFSPSFATLVAMICAMVCV
jgi:hypothetical protein